MFLLTKIEGASILAFDMNLLGNNQDDQALCQNTSPLQRVNSDQNHFFEDQQTKINRQALEHDLEEHYK